MFKASADLDNNLLNRPLARCGGSGAAHDSKFNSVRKVLLFSVLGGDLIERWLA